MSYSQATTTKITDYTLHRVCLKLPEPIGDAVVHYHEIWITVLELRTNNGLEGIGFDESLGEPPPDLTTLRKQFEYRVWPTLKDANPFNLALRINCLRGGQIGRDYRTIACEWALWDLAAKAADLPLYQLLGGTEPQVRAYASTLDFHLKDQAFATKLERFRQMGLRAVKIKVGHPDLSWDLRRLGIVREVFGADINLMVDANESWSPKETAYRANQYRNAGHKIYWIEDPIRRSDSEGYMRLCGQMGFTRINAGEYLDLTGKRSLLEQRAVDVLNLGARVNESRNAAVMASEYGIPVTMGNSIAEISVHIAASLPECLYLEFPDLIWSDLVEEPVRIEDGFAIAPDRPGLGLELNRANLEKYTVHG